MNTSFKFALKPWSKALFEKLMVVQLIGMFYLSWKPKAIVMLALRQERFDSA
jgi:hypothetical protein